MSNLPCLLGYSGSRPGDVAEEEDCHHTGQHHDKVRLLLTSFPSTDVGVPGIRYLTKGNQHDTNSN